MSKRCKHYSICEEFKHDPDPETEIAALNRRIRLLELGIRLERLSVIAAAAKKRYDGQQEAFYEEMMSQYWPKETH